MKKRLAGRPRKKNRHLPVRVYEHHGSYWYRPPNGLPRKLARVEGCDISTLAALCVPLPAQENRPTQERYPLADKLMGHVSYVGQCWQWAGTKNNDGYGQMHIAGKTLLAHRLSYEQFVGPIPIGLQLDHLCHNRSCINPAHLEPVTGSENVKRGHAHRSGLTLASFLR